MHNARSKGNIMSRAPIGVRNDGADQRDDDDDCGGRMVDVVVTRMIMMPSDHIANSHHPHLLNG